MMIGLILKNTIPVIKKTMLILDNNTDDYNSIYDIGNDDSQEELLKTRICIICGNNQLLQNFKYRFYHSNISWRRPYSFKCEKCQKSQSMK